MLDYVLIDSLAAIIKLGSFDKAAKELKVTPSAVSQRVKLLEDKLGIPLILRSQPCRATPCGEILFQYAETVRLMEQECLTRLEIENGKAGVSESSFRIALFDQRIAGWMVDVISAVCIKENIFFELMTESQSTQHQSVKDFGSHAIITEKRESEFGWKSTPIGKIRYRAVCSKRFYDRYFIDGVDKSCLSQAPQVGFAQNDSIDTMFFKLLARDVIQHPLHVVPDTFGLLQACTSGIGWGVCSAFMVSSFLANGELVELDPTVFMDIELHWHTWRQPLRRLDAIYMQMHHSLCQ